MNSDNEIPEISHSFAGEMIKIAVPIHYYTQQQIYLEQTPITLAVVLSYPLETHTDPSPPHSSRGLVPSLPAAPQDVFGDFPHVRRQSRVVALRASNHGLRG